jgi:hypothetical protein
MNVAAGCDRETGRQIWVEGLWTVLAFLERAQQPIRAKGSKSAIHKPHGIPPRREAAGHTID